MNNKVNLCASCTKEYPACDGEELFFGNGVGDDNVISCNGYTTPRNTQSSSMRAEDIAVNVLHHINEMHPDMWKGAPKIARTSIRNSIIKSSKLHLNCRAGEQIDLCLIAADEIMDIRDTPYRLEISEAISCAIGVDNDK